MLLARQLAICVSLVLAVTGTMANGAQPTQPNIVFLLADDLGSHDVGWRGSDIKTPHLDRLAASGARLNQFYVQPVCTPTRASLMTGRYPFRYGLQVGVVKPWAQYGLSLEERLLPQVLREAGYQTAIVGKWHLGHFHPDYLPTRRGFDHQYGLYNGALDYFTHIRDGGFDWHRDDKVCHDEGYATELIGREASRLIKERDPSKPLFLYVPFNGVHAPLQVPAKYADAYPQYTGKRKTYAGMVTALDDAVGTIVAALDDAKLREQTLIIFSSDNGGPAPSVQTSNGKLRAGKGTLYEGGVRVCAFATWEGRIKPSDIDTPTQMTDWYPTLLKLAGAKLEQARPVDGHDIWPALNGGTSTRDTFVLNLTPTGGAIRVGNWKLLVNGATASDQESEGAEPAGSQPKPQGKARFVKEAVELFNLAEDPGEQHNLAADQPEKVKDLQARLAAFAKEAVPPRAAPRTAGFVSPKVWGETN